MNQARTRWGWWLSAGLWVACSHTDERMDVGVATEALSVCNEAVPANRFIDGIPSYAQCAETMTSAIYSNNGIDTATTNMGAGWVRTQFSGGYQCTELAQRYLYFKWNVKWVPNGNAGSWCDTQPPASSGVVQTMAPVHGDIMVLGPGSCGASMQTGHLTVVDTVDTTKGKLSVVEQNGARRGSYNTTCGKCFLHVVANDGMNTGNPIMGAAGGAAPPPAAGGAAPSAGAPAKAPAAAGRPGSAPAGSAAPPSASNPGSPPVSTTPPQPAAPPSAPAAPTVAGSAGPTIMQPSAAGTMSNGVSSTPASAARVEEDGCSLAGDAGANGGGGASQCVFALVCLVWSVRRRRYGRLSSGCG